MRTQVLSKCTRLPRDVLSLMRPSEAGEGARAMAEEMVVVGRVEKRGRARDAFCMASSVIRSQELSS